METSELEMFLNASGAVGEYAGRGEFSLDLKQAMLRLEQFTLSEPGFYVRYLVASAVARGATRIELNTSVQTLIIEDNGSPLTFDGLTNALPSLLNSQTPENAGRRYLAVGLCGARALGFHRASVRCPQAELTLEKSRLAVTPNGSFDKTRVEITERRSLTKFAGKLLKKQSLWEHVEIALQTFRYIRAELTLNGRPVHFEHPVFQGPYVRIGSRGEEKGRELAVIETSLPISGFISLSPTIEGPLSLILHGICFESTGDFMCALIYCDVLCLDASFQALIQNEIFFDLMREISVKRWTAAFEEIGRSDPNPEVIDFAAKSLAAVEGRIPEEIRVVIESAHILGKPYWELRRIYDRCGYLPLDQEMEVVEPVFLELFPSCFRLSEITVSDTLEVLRGASGAVYAPPGRPYLLRFDEGLLTTPGAKVPVSEAVSPNDDYGPLGFQLVWTQLCPPRNDFLYQFHEFRDFGICVYRAWENGLFSLARIRPFFLNLLEWLLDVGGSIAREQWVRYGLVLEREDGELLSYGSVLQTASVPYTLDDEPLSGIPYALRLSLRELRLLRDFNEARLEPVGNRS